MLQLFLRIYWMANMIYLLLGVMTQVSAKTINDIADTVVGGLAEVNKLIAASAYVAGLGFLLATFFKLKQHKDNPTQVPIGNPLTFLILAVLLLFAGNLFLPVGEVLFGDNTLSGASIKVLE